MARLAVSSAPPNQIFVLPRELAARIEAHCAVTGDNPSDVVRDALELHFDELDGEGAENEPYVTPIDEAHP